MTTDLRRAGDGLVVELGAGDGRFARILAESGARVVRLDRRREGGGTDLVGDARRPPLRAGGAALLSAANLVRHLWREDLDTLLDRWLRCLRPGGALWILEDAPTAARPASRNYRDLQAWLAELVPGRGALRSLDQWRERLAGRPEAAAWRFGEAENALPGPAVDAVLGMLRGTGPAPEPRAAELAARIRADGLDYGTYWWARCAPGEAP